MPKIGEFELIDQIRKFATRPQSATIGIGDDCAVIPQRDGLDTLVSTDMLIEGTHFLKEDITPSQLGWKSAAVNISDIAAMGGKPIATFLSLALPKSLPETWVQEFMEGYRDISQKYCVALLGGDTTCSPDRICINVAVLGTCPSGSAKLRSAARPGDLVCVTGTLGDSAAGLKLILSNDKAASPQLVQKHYCPLPRVQEGLLLGGCPGVHAMMDISDGVGSDLRHILKESGVGAVIDTDSLPLSAELQSICREKGWDPKQLALSGGEDYELLFTMAPDEKPGIPYTVIGRITKDPALVWKGSSRDFDGYQCFKE